MPGAKKRKSAQDAQVTLACSDCGQRNYTTAKSKGQSTAVERLSLKKFCPHCQTHTLHKETK